MGSNWKILSSDVIWLTFLSIVLASAGGWGAEAGGDQLGDDSRNPGEVLVVRSSVSSGDGERIKPDVDVG